VNTPKKNDRFFIPLIGSLSVLVPALVSVLLFVDLGDRDLFQGLDFLPTLNAIINSTVSVLLLLGLLFIKKREIALHRLSMLTAFVLSAIFLISYILYHYAEGDVKYNGTGALKAVYLVILITHILCSIAVVPLAMFAIYRGLAGQLDQHRKIVRYAWPIWFYVSVTGVIVYLFAHVYNPPL
jgi:putative membrane protein